VLAKKGRCHREGPQILEEFRLLCAVRSLADQLSRRASQMGLMESDLVRIRVRCVYWAMARRRKEWSVVQLLKRMWPGLRIGGGSKCHGRRRIQHSHGLKTVRVEYLIMLIHAWRGSHGGRRIGPACLISLSRTRRPPSSPGGGCGASSRRSGRRLWHRRSCQLRRHW